MSFWSKLTRHESLFSRMAGQNDADLDLAMQSGSLTPEDYRAGVLSCSICTDPDQCEAGLDRGDHAIPGFCRNRKIIERLAGSTP